MHLSDCTLKTYNEPNFGRSLIDIDYIGIVSQCMLIAISKPPHDLSPN